MKKILSLAVIILLLQSCVSTSTEMDRITFGDDNYGIDVKFNQSKEVERIYIQGPPNYRWLVEDSEEYIVIVGYTADNRQYVSISRR